MNPPYKNKVIIDLISRIDAAIGKDNYQLVDNWDDEIDAVGIAHPKDRKLIVYICAYDTGYFVSTEFPRENQNKKKDALPYNPGKNYNDLKFDELIEIILKHFGLN